MSTDTDKLPKPDDYPPATFFEAMRRHMATHATFYAIASLFFLQQLFTSIYDNFWPLEPEQMAQLGWWQKAAVLFKSISPAIGVALGYIIKPHGAQPAK